MEEDGSGMIEVPRMTVDELFEKWESQEAGPGDRVQLEGVLSAIAGLHEVGEIPIECWLTNEIIDGRDWGRSRSVKIVGDLEAVLDSASPLVGGEYSDPTYLQPVLITGKLAWCDFPPYRLAMVYLERVVYTDHEPPKEVILDDAPRGDS